MPSPHERFLLAASRSVRSRVTGRVLAALATLAALAALAATSLAA